MFDLAKEEVNEGSIKGLFFYVTLGINPRADNRHKVPWAVVDVIDLVAESAEGFETTASSPAVAAVVDKKTPSSELKRLGIAAKRLVEAVEEAMPPVDPDGVALGLLAEEGHPAPGTQEFAEAINARVKAADDERRRIAVQSVTQALESVSLRELIVQEAVNTTSSSP